MKLLSTYFTGVVIAFLIAFCAVLLESLLPIHLVGASVIALFSGMVINTFWHPDKRFQPGLKFTASKVLKLSIIFLGASLNINTILYAGRMSLLVLFFTFSTCFGGGYFLGRLIGLNWKISSLISTGTGICGGSAIAATAPVIDAGDNDVAYAIAVTFLFDLAMIIIYPIIGRSLSLSDFAFGLWAGTSVNDTSSVVATAYSFSDLAGNFATMVKLTRTLFIIPTVMVFSFINTYIKNNVSAKNASSKHKLKIISLFPWFIVGFIVMAVINSYGLFSTDTAIILNKISKFGMIAALAAIGLNTNIMEMKKSGIKPLIHGFIISALVALVAISAGYFLGLA